MYVVESNLTSPAACLNEVSTGKDAVAPPGAATVKELPDFPPVKLVASTCAESLFVEIVVLPLNPVPLF